MVAAAATEVRLGSFLLGRRLDEVTADGVSIVAMEASGAPGSSFDGRAAILRCLPQRTPSAEESARAKQAFAQLRGLRHPAIAAVLEAGIANGVTFIAEMRPAGARLIDRLGATERMPPAKVRRIVEDIGGALAALHAAGLTHGRVAAATIWVRDDGGATLGGFLAGSTAPDGTGASSSGINGAADDQRRLAQVAATAISGQPFSGDRRVGDALPSVPSGIVSVLARATASQPSMRFPSVAAFTEAFMTAMSQAGQDLVAGVWEAASRTDHAMGALMLEMAETYAPSHPDLPLLRARINGNDASTLSSYLANGVDLSATGNLSAGPTFGGAVLPNAGRSPADEAAIAALLSLPSMEQPVKPKPNPWIGFAVGLLVMVLILIVAAAMSMSYT